MSLKKLANDDDDAMLIFIPSPGLGHLVSTVEFANLLVRRHHRLSVAILIINLPFDSKVTTYTQSLATKNTSDHHHHHRIRFLHLPHDHFDFTAQIDPKNFITTYIESHKPCVREAIADLAASFSSGKLAGVVIDMFCTAMIDVANELSLPTYVFFTSNAAFLGLMFHIQTLLDCHGKALVAPGEDLEVPGFTSPVPSRFLPASLLEEDGFRSLSGFARRFREAKGILVNTLEELEPYPLSSLNSAPVPTIYPVGPVLNLNPGDDNVLILKWLDDQPESSVVFLCFGSMGTFGEEQISEIATALERSGHRFLWSLRKAPAKGEVSLPSDYADVEEGLPEGFTEHSEKGKVIGWAPQVAVLGHPAIGGFVSHCGWNSVLESLWFGVPIAAWPIYAEQQLNAFEMVEELGLAAEIKMDYRVGWKEVVGGRSELTPVVAAEEIEAGIRRLMATDGDTGVLRKKVEEMKQQCRRAVMDGGSSHASIGHFADDLISYVNQ